MNSVMHSVRNWTILPRGTHVERQVQFEMARFVRISVDELVGGHGESGLRFPSGDMWLAGLGLW